MPKKKSEYQKVAGKLISAIQKEWGAEMGCSTEEFSENVMGSAHLLLQAGTTEKAKELLSSMSVRQFLGEVWVQGHPNVKPAILALQDQLDRT